MSLDLYRVCIEVGNKEMAGAPLLHVQALVDAPTGRISGQAEITQAIAPPGGLIKINDVKGRLYPFSPDPEGRLVKLQGTYWQSFPPPAIGEIERKFEAILFIARDKWQGGGSFTYGTSEVTDVPVVSCPSSED